VSGPTSRAVAAAFSRVSAALAADKERLTELDQAVGDGDLGITAGKIAAALGEYAATDPLEDVGTYVAKAGMVVNQAASSSLGTLLATALMRAGKEVKGRAELTAEDLALMFRAADAGIQERGKVKPGDKTIVDVSNPAANAFAEAVAEGAPLRDAGRRMLEAAREGMEAVTPLRSRVGRAGWVGERSEGQVDPGCAAGMTILRAIAVVDEESL
jgi:dihydroxyacetone kinase-like protein